MKASLLSCATAALLFVGCAGPRNVTDPDNHPVYYNLQCSIRDGQQDAFRALMAELVASSMQEPGTLVYEWYLAPDGKSVHIHEYFADTAAYQQHSATFGSRFADRFMPTIEIDSFHVYGNADEAAREMLGTVNPTYYQGIGGFRR